MATDTAPDVTFTIVESPVVPGAPAAVRRRNYWQLPLFVLGVTAAIAAWRAFPPKPDNPTESFQKDLIALKQAVDRTYTPEIFGTPEVTPLRTLEPNLHILGLSNGPTLAFKDLAMQLLGNLFEYELARRGEELNILGATSGDTGSAAEYAMRGKAGVNVFKIGRAHV